LADFTARNGRNRTLATRLLATTSRSCASILRRSLETFDFRAASARQDLMNAIEALREMNRSDARKVPVDAPTAFVKPRNAFTASVWKAEQLARDAEFDSMALLASWPIFYDWRA
jgi:hypothetical protein